MEGEEAGPQQDMQCDSADVEESNNGAGSQQVAMLAAEGSSQDAPTPGALQDEAGVSKEAAEGEAQEYLTPDQVEGNEKTSQEQPVLLVSTEGTVPQAQSPADSDGQQAPKQTSDATADMLIADKNMQGHGSGAAPAALTEQPAVGQQPAATANTDNTDNQAELVAAAEHGATAISTPAAADAATLKSAAELTNAHHASTASKPSFDKLEQPVQQLPVSQPPAVALVVPPALVQDEATAGKLTENTPATKPHKETAVERLTAPTAMRMLKTLQQTQGNKAEWHIATGVVFKSKKLNSDEMSAMVDRLCVAKHADDNLPSKLHAVKLVYVDNKETYEPVKEVTKEENISYMSELYSRCQETRSKTQQQLADKYLQPLIKPREKTSNTPDKP